MTKENAFVFFCLTHTDQITDKGRMLVIGLKVAVSCGFVIAWRQLMCYPQMFQGSWFL